ncbi:MAG TPA: M20/M25/M40 family metallo-hydrolase [Thermomicrobiales bacterium]|nr:M20/M25/M40 family metallo-hydrolase [Thermomicrobiales bacterium]
MNQRLDWDLLAHLSVAPGIGGCEDAVRAVVLDYLADIEVDVTVDNLGNVIAVKGTNGPLIAMSAHMDEIGFMVSHIDEDGFLSLQPVGFWEAKTLNAQQVTVTNSAGLELLGTIQAGRGVPPYPDGPKVEQATIQEFYVDLGLDHDQVHDVVELGDMVTMRRQFTQTDTTVSGKSLDDRAGLFAMLEAFRRVDTTDVQVAMVASVQEEVGCRGAEVAAYLLNADFAIGLDVTQAIDLPPAKPRESVTRLHHGVAIKLFDKSMLPNRKLNRHLRDIAERNSIPYQLEVLPVGGQDGASFQQSRAGIVATTLSIPTRYLHSPNERASKRDIGAMVDLLVAALPEIGTRSYIG